MAVFNSNNVQRVEYGYAFSSTAKVEYWPGWTEAKTIAYCQAHDLTIIARDVSPTRVVSIR